MSYLNPYSGEWTASKAAFLLGRTTFGVSKTDLDQSVSLGLKGTLDKLLEDRPLPAPPIHADFEFDQNAPPGTSWVYTEAIQSDEVNVQGARRRSLWYWWVGLIQQESLSLREKMTLFWHEHFAVNTINNANQAYQYSTLLREHALGNFKSLVEKMTINPAMLIFLNGKDNTKENPNENYSRELLELFTIGRGDAVAEGDYTNYTEKDITELARALTGWVNRTDEDNVPYALYRPFRHDKEPKQLSHRFDNIMITNGDETEYLEVINLILDKKEVARFIARQLHVWFVHANIDDRIEEEIIIPLGDLIYNNNYEIIPAIRTLLTSEYFLDGGHEGCMITSPLDFSMKILKGCNVIFADSNVFLYRAWRLLYNFCADQDMKIMDIPSVAGWKAYYQEPSYYQFWINSFTLSERKQFVDVLLDGMRIRGEDLIIDGLDLAANISQAEDPNLLINGIAELLYPVPLGENQLSFLKETLIPGLPDFEWTVEYLAYLSDPDDRDKRESINTKLKALINAMLNLPEIHLM